MIQIDNESQKILSTNYWESEDALRGMLFLSWNAGAARVLLPDSHVLLLKEMQSGKYVIISRGPWTEQGDREGLELLFEDNSYSPFCLYLLAEQCDRLLPDTDQKSNFSVNVWTREGEKLRLPGKYRQVESVPSLAPWAD